MDGQKIVSGGHQLRISTHTNNPSSPLYRGDHDITQVDAMTKFSCWKPLVFFTGLVVAMVGLIFAGAGFGFFGVGGLASAPVGAAICTVGLGLMTGSGLLMYIEKKEQNPDFSRSSISPPTLYLSPSAKEILDRYKIPISASPMTEDFQSE
jgi:hypothetical protein